MLLIEEWVQFARSGLILIGDCSRPAAHGQGVGQWEALLAVVVCVRDLEPLNGGCGAAGHKIKFRHRGILPSSPLPSAAAPQTNPEPPHPTPQTRSEPRKVHADRTSMAPLSSVSESSLSLVP